MNREELVLTSFSDLVNKLVLLNKHTMEEWRDRFVWKRYQTAACMELTIWLRQIAMTVPDVLPAARGWAAQSCWIHWIFSGCRNT